MGDYGTANGQFNNPAGVAVNSTGYVYVADSGNGRVQVFDPSGEYVTNWSTSFASPVGIAVNKTDYVYVTVTSGTDEVLVYDPSGTQVGVWGGYSKTGANGLFYFPQGISVNKTGYVYVVDLYNNRTQWFTISGTYLGQWGSLSGYIGGSANGQFWLPEDIAVNSSSYVYVADEANDRIQVFDPSGTYVTKWAITSPFGVAVDASDNVYVDSNIPSPPSAPVYIYTPDGTEEGSFTTSSGTLDYPLGIAVNSTGYIYVCDGGLGSTPGHNRIVVFSPYSASTTYTVTYNGNGNTGGTAPVDGSSPYASGATVTVLGAGSLVKTGYTFNGWNTAAGGTGTSYAAGATFTISADTTLYAQWTPTTYTVTYSGNGNTGGTAPVDGSSPYTSSATVTVLGAGSLVRTGYTFNDWNTAFDGTGTSYAPTATFTMGSANVILYAQWTLIPGAYTVTYSGNGNTGGTAPVDSSGYTSGATVTVLGNTGSLARTGYTFSGWNTAAGGGGTNYAAGATFTISADTTLYAQWTATPTPTSANGGGRSAGTFYWAYTGNTEEYGYTGPAPTPLMSSPNITIVPTMQQTIVTAMATPTPAITDSPLPANTPKSGLDMVPALGALGLCGVIFLFRKNGK